MLRIKCVVLSCIACVCILSNCSVQQESLPTGDAALPTTVPTSTAPFRTADTPIDVESISIFDLSSQFGESFVLIDLGVECDRIYRLLIVKDPQEPNSTSAYRAYIECYEMGEISADFFNGEKVRVFSAYRNVVNISDYHIFGVRFNMLKTVDIAEVATDIDRGQYLVCPETAKAFDLSSAQCGENAADVESDDMGLLEFMYLLFEDRGVGGHGKQHF